MAGDPKFSPVQEAASCKDRSSSLHRKMTEGTGSANCWADRVTRRPENKEGKGNFANGIF